MYTLKSGGYSKILKIPVCIIFFSYKLADKKYMFKGKQLVHKSGSRGIILVHMCLRICYFVEMHKLGKCDKKYGKKKNNKNF